jgi:hypothetical protein
MSRLARAVAVGSSAISKLMPARNRTLLDYGCGSGTTVLLRARLHLSNDGTDITQGLSGTVVWYRNYQCDETTLCSMLSPAACGLYISST